MTVFKGMIFTKDCVFGPGSVVIEDDKITEVQLCDKSELSTQEQEQYLIPGLVDVHFHGAAGYDFCDGTEEAYRAIAGYEKRNGVTTICPATMTLPIEEISKIVCTAVSSKLESLRGIHLEGPFISKEKKGAQKEDYIIPARSIGIDDLVGSIEEGKRADIVFADKDLNREIVMIGGKMIIE